MKVQSIPEIDITKTALGGKVVLKFFVQNKYDVALQLTPVALHVIVSLACLWRCPAVREHFQATLDSYLVTASALKCVLLGANNIA